MRLVIQRVSRASVEIGEKPFSSIGRGLLILIGITEGDTAEDVEWLASKTANMRIFPDEKGVMNLSVKDIEGEVLAVSQFTLMASTRKGNRPSYIHAAGHQLAVPLYELFIKRLSELLNRNVAQGEFGADMQVSLINDGPVTIIIDSRLRE